MANFKNERTGLLQRAVERFGNPLEWSNVDKCLLIASLTFPFSLIYVALARYGLENPDVVPYVNRESLPTIILAASTTAVVWLMIIATARYLRSRAPQSRWLVHVTLQWWVLGNVYIVYTYGMVTSPVAMQLLGGVMVGVLLFDVRTVLPATATAMMLLVAMIVGERAGWLPYAQLLSSPPYVDGRLSSVWIAVNFGLFAIIASLIFGFSAYVIVRWRDREARLAELTDFLKKTFGRYLSPEVMASLLSNPESVELGGQKRRVSIMMTDIRGFTQLSERLEPERVVTLLNRYLRVMIEICEKHKGTVNDIIGDALLVTFGAPHDMPEHAEAAVACGIEMQNAMRAINDENLRDGLPVIEMGIGLNTAEVVVGNIGSERRSKYGVVGSGVNLASRIESYAVGGQVLVSSPSWTKPSAACESTTASRCSPRERSRPS